MLNTSVTTVTAVQAKPQHLKDEGQGVAKELSNEVFGDWRRATKIPAKIGSVTW